MSWAIMLVLLIVLVLLVVGSVAVVIFVFVRRGNMYRTDEEADFDERPRRRREKD
jgi:flagellar basal body-associated protein FliL